MTDEEYPVHESKAEFEAVLLAEAERRGCRQMTRKARLDCLARQCSTPEVLARADEKAPLSGATLWRNVAHANMPDWPTLHKLVAGTAIPLVRWLLALHCISLDEMAGVLDREVAVVPLSGQERELLAEWRRLPCEIQAWLPDMVRVCPVAHR